MFLLDFLASLIAISLLAGSIVLQDDIVAAFEIICAGSITGSDVPAMLQCRWRAQRAGSGPASLPNFAYARSDRTQAAAPGLCTPD